MLAQAGNDPSKFTELVKQRYQGIVAGDKSQAKFLKGWLDRADAALAASSGMASAGLPQVEALDDATITAAKTGYAWWDRLGADQKIGLVRAAEANVGSGLANQRGDVTRGLKDMEATMLAGKEFPDANNPKYSRDNLVRLYGPEAGNRSADLVDYYKQVGAIMSHIQTMPAEQAQGLLKKLEPAGGDEFAAKNPVYQHALAAFSNLQKQRNEDYMGWALGVQGTGVQKLNFQNADNFRETLSARIGPANTGKNDYGADAHLLSKDEAAQIGDFLNSQTPDVAMNYLKQIRKATVGHDDWYADALTQIAPKNTMLAHAAAISNKSGSVDTKGGAQNGDIVGMRILQGAQILQGKDLGDPTKSGKPADLEDKVFRTYFWNVVGPTAFSSPDSSRSARMAEDTYQAAKNYMVADMYARGVTPTTVNMTADTVRNAITAVTGGVDKSTGSTLFVPWGMKQSEFKQQFSSALDVALVNNGIKGTSMDSPRSYTYQNVGDGKYLVLAGGKTLVGTNGSTIVDMSKFSRGR